MVLLSGDLLIWKCFGAFVAILHVWLQFAPGSGIDAISIDTADFTFLAAPLSKSLSGLRNLCAFPSDCFQGTAIWWCCRLWLVLWAWLKNNDIFFGTRSEFSFFTWPTGHDSQMGRLSTTGYQRSSPWLGRKNEGFFLILLGWVGISPFLSHMVP